MTYTVKQGDVLEVTRGYPDACFDGLFCDPPYGWGFMGKSWDTFASEKIKQIKPKSREKEVFYSYNPDTGRYGKHHKGMGKACEAGSYDQSRQGHLNFQEFMYQWAKEALRVLKPGAWGLVFGGTRTWHRLACALEDAGFELRDTLMWLYGSGFDKSCDISKRIDIAAGAKREVVGRYIVPSDSDAGNAGKLIRSVTQNGGCFGSTAGKEGTAITAPITPEAKLWDGYGTGLKPSWEPCLLIRKPLGYVTCEELYALTGWDRFVVESSRGDIKHVTHKALREGVDTFRDVYKKNEETKKWEFVRREALGGYKPFRASTNVVNALKHGCGGLNIDGGRIEAGEDHKRNCNRKEVESHWRLNQSPRQEVQAHPQGRWPANLILDEDSAAMLDAQSGELISGGGRKGNVKNGVGIFGSGKAFDTENVEPNKGGASRFFYCAKASPSERNAGLEGFEGKEIKGDISFRSNGVHGQTGKSNKPIISRNHHPTVKPLDLCRYLANLILPPFREGDPRKLYVPFCGSGSEMIGAYQANWEEIDGVEIDPEYCKIAKARLKFWTCQLKLAL